MTIGFIGLGTMGTPMCLNILKAGLPLKVYNRTKEKAQTVIEAGADFCETPQQVVDSSDATIIMISDDNAVRETINNLQLKNKSLVNMSTISVDLTTEIAAKAEQEGWEFGNAPVSGTKKPAEDGTLVILYGGSKIALDNVQPAFDAMGKDTVNAGTSEEATKLKLVVNFLLGGMLEHYAESIAMCDKVGLSRDSFLHAVDIGPLQCGYYKLKGQNILNENYDPAFMTKHMFKDLVYLDKELEKKGFKRKSNVTEIYAETNKEFPEEDLSAVFKTVKK